MWRLITILTLCAAVTSCSWLPNEGPSTDAVLNEQSAGAPRYLLIDLNTSVAQILRSRRPDKSLASFGDGHPSEELVIAVGDVVTVTIWEAAPGGLFSGPLVVGQFSTGSKSAIIPPQVVDRSGVITIPYAGAIHVVGSTPRQVQAYIEKALTEKAIQPQALVSVANSPANSATVLGEVVEGKRVPLSVKGDRVLDVIAEAGGIKSPVRDTFIELTRGNRTVRVAMTRVVADHREDVFVRPGDVLTVIRDPQTFISYGATGHNDEIPFPGEEISLSEALALASGSIDNRADAAGVFVIRFEPESIARILRPNSPLVEPGKLTPVIYHLDMHDPNSLLVAQQFPIFNRDVLYVSDAQLVALQKVMEIFSLAVTPAGSVAELTRVAQ
jgi:polysaccharide export outer membrane protein